MKEESAGIIPIHKDSKDILLVHHLTGHWGFPKGHLENGETPLQAALRELVEEVGITEVDITGEPIVKTYLFEKDGVPIEKKISYYPGLVKSKDVIIKEDEIEGYAWLPHSQALERLTFSREILESIKL